MLKSPPPKWVLALFLIPMALALLAGLASFADGGWLASLLSVLTVLWVAQGLPGRHLFLMLALVAWLGLAMLVAMSIAALTNLIIGSMAAMALIILALWLTVRIAVPWGHERYDRMAARGRPMREWEWVYTGPDFARAHPLHKILGGHVLVAGFVCVVGYLRFGLGWAVLFGPAGGVWAKGWLGAVAVGLLVVLLIVLTLMCILTVVLLLRRSTGAWHLTWLFLVLGLPWSIPLMFYWAEGRRPNLIYRHRFERLVPLDKSA